MASDNTQRSYSIIPCFIFVEEGRLYWHARPALKGLFPLCECQGKQKHFISLKASRREAAKLPEK